MGGHIKVLFLTFTTTFFFIVIMAKILYLFNFIWFLEIIFWPHPQHLATPREVWASKHTKCYHKQFYFFQSLSTQSEFVTFILFAIFTA